MADRFPKGTTVIDGTPIDAMGNPLVKVGCSNCGKGNGWMDALEYSGRCNAGSDPAGPCSRRCRLQFDYAKMLGPGGGDRG